MEAVHYRGEAPMWQDLAAGVIQAASGSYAAASNVLQSGAGKAIAVPQTRRMGKLPDVATFLEQGVTSKAFQLKGFICLVGPAGLAPDIVARLSALMVEGGKSERIQKLLDTFGVDEFGGRPGGLQEALRRGEADLDQPRPGPRPDAAVMPSPRFGVARASLQRGARLNLNQRQFTAETAIALRA